MPLEVLIRQLQGKAKDLQDQIDGLGGGGYSPPIPQSDVIDLVADLAALSAALAGKAPTAHTHAATDIGSGAVSNTEFGYLDGVTSALQTQLNAKATDSAVVHKAGDAMTGDLTVPNVLGDVGAGAFYMVDSSDWNSDLWLGADGSINLENNIDGLSASLAGNALQVLGNVSSTGGFLSAPKFKTVPNTGSKTLLLTTADCGIVLIGSAPTTGGLVKLPILATGDSANYLLVNLSSNAVSVQPQGSNSLVRLAGIGNYTLNGRTVVGLAYEGPSTTSYYQTAPEA